MINFAAPTDRRFAQRSLISIRAEAASLRSRSTQPHGCGSELGWVWIERNHVSVASRWVSPAGLPFKERVHTKESNSPDRPLRAAAVRLRRPTSQG